MICFACAALLALESACAETAGLARVELTRVDDQATGYATFQSHNQKVVRADHGIYMTHIRTRNEDYTAQGWRLLRSRDGGSSFETLHESVDATNPPVLEVDEAGNLYLVRPDFVDGNAYLYRFAADRLSDPPRVTTIPRGAAGKFSMIYDRARAQLYYFAHNNTFHIIGLDGEVRSSRDLLRHGKHAVLQYPLLSLGRDGLLHAAWTTQKRGVYLYWDIHQMVSPDGGRTWRTLAGTPLGLPVTADVGGAGSRVSCEDEYLSHTWLSSHLAKDGKVHFLYLAQTDPPRQHYVRYDARAGAEEVRISPKFSGDRVSLRGLDGFFAASESVPGGPLYCIGHADGRIGCLASDDDGATWYDYAVTGSAYRPYSIGGCRAVTKDGYIIGSFTDQLGSTTELTGSCHVYFFRIRAGLSSARIVEKRSADGRTVLRFGDVRGQPREVRFRSEAGDWTAWRPFGKELELRESPDAFQLRGFLGTVSSEVAIR